jgi:hypothetical protein
MSDNKTPRRSRNKTGEKATGSPTSVADAAVTKSGAGSLFVLTYKNGERRNQWFESVAREARYDCGVVADRLKGDEVAKPKCPTPRDAINAVAGSDSDSDSDSDADDDEGEEAHGPEEADLTPSQKKVYDEMIKGYLADKKDDKLKSGKVIAFALLHMEVALQNAVTAEYKKLHEKCDLYKFRKAVIKCVSKDFELSDEALRSRCEAELVAYRSQSQGSKETLEDVKKRLEFHMERRAALKMPALSDREQAHAFIAALDKRYTELVVFRENKKKQGLGMPDSTPEQRAIKEAQEYVPNTLQLAYEQAMGWKVAKSELEVMSVSFVAMKAQNQSLQKQLDKVKAQVSAPPPPAPGKDKSKGNRTEPRPKKEAKERPPPTRPCICGELHYFSDCTEKEAIAKAYAASKAAAERAPAEARASGASQGGGGRVSYNAATVAIRPSMAWADAAGASVIDMELDVPSVNFGTISIDMGKLSFGGTRLPDADGLALLDTCASDFTIKDSYLVRNVRKLASPLEVVTMAGTSQQDTIADSMCFGTTIFDKECPFNILPFHLMERMHRLTAFKNDDITHAVEVYFEQYDLTITFTIVNNVLVGDISPLRGRPFIEAPPLRPMRPELAIAAASTRGIEAALLRQSMKAAKKPIPEGLAISQRQYRDAVIARDMQKRLCYPSSDAFRQAISQGTWQGSVQPNDVKRADRILGGLSEPILQGKSKKATPLEQKLEESLQEGELVAYMDIFKCGGSFYLISTCSPGKYSNVYTLGNTAARAISNLRGPVLQSIAFFKPFGYEVKIVSVDGEGAVKKLEPEINVAGARVVPRSKGAGVPHVDNMTRVIKERCRCIIAGVVFVVAAMLYPFLIAYVVKMLNFTPTSANIGQQSPFQFLTGGRSVKIDNIAPAAWGDYCQVDDENRIGRNLITTPRKISAIYLGPQDEFGKHGFLNLQTLRLFSREHFTRLTMPTDAIDRLNELARLGPPPPDDPDEGGNEADAETDAAADGPAEASPPPDVYENPNIATPGTDRAREHTPVSIETDERVGVADQGLFRVPLTGGGEPPASIFRLQVSPDRSTAQAAAHPVDSSTGRAAARASPAKAPSPMNLNAEIEEAIDRPPDFDPPPSRPVRSTRGQLPTRYLASSVRLVKYADIKGGMAFAQVNYKKAFAGYGQSATEALIAEITGMLERQVFHGVLRSSLTTTQQKKIIRSSVFFKEKFKGGVFERLKARLVAGGNQQDKSLYDQASEISSPTVSTTSVFSVVATAAAKGYKVVTFDIGQAYLNAEMPGEVYVTLDPASAEILCQIDPSYTRFLERGKTMVVQLDKALYGCVESARLFYEHLKTELTRQGYDVNPLDPCVFIKPCADGGQTTVCFHVDDALATSPDQAELDKLVADMKTAFHELKVTTGDVHEYLGMKLDFSIPGQCEATMRKYIADIIEEFQVTGLARTPAALDLFDIDANSPVVPEDIKERFHRGTAQCLYLATHVRPDILVAVSFLTTRVQAPTEQDTKKLIRLLRYLNQTQELGLVLGGDAEGNFHLSAYVDASFGVHADGKSHTGMFITIGRGIILAKSVKQKIVAKSSCEAELIGLSDISSLLAWQQEWMTIMGDADHAYPGFLYEDNMSAMRLAENGRSTSDRTKHIKLRYFFIKQYLDSGEFVLKHCSTDRMIADILTKPLQGDHFEALRDILLGYSFE